MSSDRTSFDDSDYESAVSILGGHSLRTMLLLYGALCAVIVGAYYLWIRPAMDRTADAVAETRSAQHQLWGEVQSSKQQADTLAAAVEAVQSQTATHYENANQEINDVRNQVKDLEGVVVKTNRLLSQGSGDLGARIASKVFQRADLIPIKNRADALSKDLDSLRTEFDVWTKTQEDFLEGDRGRAVAVDEKLVDRFAAIELPTVTQLDIQTWTDVLPTLVQPMRDALEQDEPSLIPLEEYTSRVDGLAQQIGEASAAIRKARVAIAAIEEKAEPTRVTEETPALRQALEDREIRVADELLEKQTQEEDKKRDELAKRLADEETKSESQAAAQRIERIEAERAAEQARHEAARKRAALKHDFKRRCRTSGRICGPIRRPGTISRANGTCGRQPRKIPFHSRHFAGPEAQQYASRPCHADDGDIGGQRPADYRIPAILE